MNIVRFSPDGELVCTGGADGQAFLYNGKTAEKVTSLGGDKAHSGGIYCVGPYVTILCVCVCAHMRAFACGSDNYGQGPTECLIVHT